jgi:hypothetical protein
MDSFSRDSKKEVDGIKISIAVLGVLGKGLVAAKC